MTDMRRITISLPEELDKKILELKKSDHFVRCSYSEIVRQMMEHGYQMFEAERANDTVWGEVKENMTAEHYLKEKERLSQALNGQDRLMEAVKDITEILSKYNLHVMPCLSYDVVRFTLETRHMEKFDLSGRQ